MSPRASEDKTRTNPHFIPQAPEPLNHVCFKLNVVCYSLNWHVKQFPPPPQKKPNSFWCSRKKCNFKSVSWAKNAKTTFLSCTLKKKKNYRTQSDFQVLRKLNQTLFGPFLVIIYVNNFPNCLQHVGWSHWYKTCFLSWSVDLHFLLHFQKP